MKFMRLLSRRATQQFTYNCDSSIGWYDELNASYDKAIQLMGHDGSTVNHESDPDAKLFEILEDSCTVR